MSEKLRLHAAEAGGILLRIVALGISEKLRLHAAEAGGIFPLCLGAVWFDQRSRQAKAIGGLVRKIWEISHQVVVSIT